LKSGLRDLSLFNTDVIRITAHNFKYKNLLASVQLSDQVQNWRQLVSALEEWISSLKMECKNIIKSQGNTSTFANFLVLKITVF
jgi:hypothetical protein